MPELLLHPYSALNETEPGAIVAFGVGVDGLPYIVTALELLDDRVNQGGASFPKIRPDLPQGYRIHQGTPGTATLVTTIAQEAFNIDLVQPIGRDGILLISSRCQYRQDGADENGRLYHGDGGFLHGITLGDGIQDAAITPDGLIWTSYFDEGVFGNFGWSKPLGNSGLVAWRTDGTVAYTYAPPAGLDRICDCYAMNACGNDIWIYYYTEFPLVRIHHGAIAAHWQIPLRGADAFAISGNHALFRGGYDNRDIYHLIDLAQPAARETSRIQLRDRHGETIHAERVAARGGTLFLLRNREIFKLTVEDARRFTQ